MAPNCWLLLLFSLPSVIAHEDNGDLQGPTCQHHGDVRFGYPLPVGNVDGDDMEGGISPSDIAFSCQYEDVIYFVNDIAGRNVIYAVNAATAEIVGNITLINVTNVDWESVATGRCRDGVDGCCIYVHDSGSTGDGPDHMVYMVKEETNPATAVTKPPDQIIEYTFQPGNDDVSSNSIFVDCEGNIYFFDMAFRGRQVRLYQIKMMDGQYVAVGIFQLDIPTTDNGPAGASLSADCCELLIKMEDRVYHIPFSNGKLDKEQLTILFCMPNREEEAIGWHPSGDKYCIIAENKPHMLKCATRNLNVPESMFGLGTNLGYIDGSDNMAGVAASRKQWGYVYAVADSGGSQGMSNALLIIQTCHAQTVGKIEIEFESDSTAKFNDVEDMAVGPCISVLGTGTCIFLNDAGPGDLGTPLYRMYVFKEVDYMYGTTGVTLGADNVITYSGTAGETEATMVGCDGTIYVMGYVHPEQDFDIYKLVQTTGSDYTAVKIATYTNPSRMPGPKAADISPCCDEIILKFKDSIFLHKLVDDDVAAALPDDPKQLAYVPAPSEDAITFSADCKSYFTTADLRGHAPLRQYDRLQCCNKKPEHDQ